MNKYLEKIKQNKCLDKIKQNKYFSIILKGLMSFFKTTFSMFFKIMTFIIILAIDICFVWFVARYVVTNVISIYWLDISRFISSDINNYIYFITPSVFFVIVISFITLYMIYSSFKWWVRKF